MTNSEYTKSRQKTTKAPVNPQSPSRLSVTVATVTLNTKCGLKPNDSTRRAPLPAAADSSDKPVSFVSLGSNAISASKNAGNDDAGKKRRESRRARYTLQRVSVGALGAAFGRDGAAARKWIGRLDSCHKMIIPGESVKVKAGAPNKHYYGGLVHCGSAYCPHCAPIIANQRAAKVARAVGAAVKKGWVAVHVTYTFAHTRLDDVRESDGKMRAALRAMRSGRAWQDFKRAAGYVGAASSPEHTQSNRNGYHPHAHILMFFNPAAIDDSFIERLTLRAARARSSAANYDARGERARAAAARGRAESLEERAYMVAAAAAELRAAVKVQAGLNESMRALDAELTALQTNGDGSTGRALELLAELKRARRQGAPARGLTALLDDLWAGALENVDLTGLEGRRVVASYAPASIGDYLTKTGRASGMALELTSSTTKHGRAGSRTMHDLLTAAANGDAAAGRTWAVWRKAVRGRATFATTKGFRELVAESERDNPLPALEEPTVIMELLPETWRAVVWAGQRVKLLELSESDIESAHQLLIDLPKDAPF